MIISKIIKFENIKQSSHYYFEKAVNDALAEIQRAGGYIMNVRFDCQAEPILFNGLEQDQIGAKTMQFYYAFILYNSQGRHTPTPVEDRNPPPKILAKDDEYMPPIWFRGVDMSKAPFEIQAIYERMMRGDKVGVTESKEVNFWVDDQKI